MFEVQADSRRAIAAAPVRRKPPPTLADARYGTRARPSRRQRQPRSATTSTGCREASAPSWPAAAGCRSSAACTCRPTSAHCGAPGATTGCGGPGCSSTPRCRHGDARNCWPSRCTASRPANGHAGRRSSSRPRASARSTNACSRPSVRTSGCRAPRCNCTTSPDIAAAPDARPMHRARTGRLRASSGTDRARVAQRGRQTRTDRRPWMNPTVTADSRRAC